MDAEKIIQDMNRRFVAPLPEFYKRRIVIWIDEDQEFVDKLDKIMINGAKVVLLPELLSEGRRGRQPGGGDLSTLLHRQQWKNHQRCPEDHCGQDQRQRSGAYLPVQLQSEIAEVQQYGNLLSHHR